MTWTCQRVQGKVRCGTVNQGTAKKCASCGKLRAKKRPTVASQIEGVPYERFLELNGGVEMCGICGRTAAGERRLHRDHDHKTGQARGLLCHVCNRLLGRVERKGMSADWLVAAGAYLKRTAVRYTEARGAPPIQGVPSDDDDKVAGDDPQGGRELSGL